MKRIFCILIATILTCLIYAQNSDTYVEGVEAYSYVLEMRSTYNETNGQRGAFIDTPGQGTDNSNGEVKLTNVKWKLTSIVTGGKAKAPEQDADNRYWLIFKDDNTFTGRSSTNDISGNYKINTQTSSFLMTNFGGTKIGELDGYLFVDALKAVRSFDLREGALKLYYNETDYLFFNIYKERKIIKALQYEMAVVRAVSFPQKDGLDSFGFELIKRYAEVQPAPVVPFKGQVPNPYRIDGLPVIISGNVFDSLAVSGLPDTVPSNLFELTFIYERNPGIVAIYCDPCRDKRTVKVLDDEPATVRRNNVFQTKDKDISISIDAASIDTFAFELQNRYKDVMPCPVVSRYPVPEKYRINGLKVKISGEITNCYVGLSAPDARYMPQNIFELTSIK